MEDLKRATVATLAELNRATWFNEVGKPLGLEPGNEHKVRLCVSWNEAVKQCSKLNWENIQLEAANTLRDRIRQSSLERFTTWNDVVDKVKPITEELIDSKTSDTVRRNQLPKVVRDNVRWDILHLFMEAEYSDIVRPTFFAALSYWYSIGHFPCGWEGKFPNGKLVVF